MAESTSTCSSSTLPLEHKTFGGKLQSYLEKNPSNNDVTFCVGPHKTKVRALKIAVKAASLEFKTLFETKWEKEIDTIDGIISLPQFEPVAFQTLLQLLYFNNLTAEDVISMKLSFETLNNLTNIAYELKIWNMGLWQILYAAKAKLLRENISSYIVSREFFELSRETLTEILGSEHITLKETTLFESACKWAERRCIQNKIEPTGRNIRDTLGDALFKIRFSLMSSFDFFCFVCPTNVLTHEEEESLLESIQFDEVNQTDLSEINKKMRRLRLVDRSVTLNFFRNEGVQNDPPYICDGREQSFGIQVSQNIVLESVGFLGPVEANGVYDVTMKLIYMNGKQVLEELITEIQTKVQAERCTVFHVPFSKPVNLNATFKSQTRPWRDGFYSLKYYLKGPNSQTLDIPRDENGNKEISTLVKGVTLYCGWGSFQLVELRFKRTSPFQ